MSQKQADSDNKPTVPIFVIGIVVALGVGVYIGSQSQTSEEAPGGSGPAQSDSEVQAPPEGMTPAQVAEAKNVPEFLEDSTGKYQLVSVIESAEANRKLTQNLQVVGTQRQRLLALSRQFEGLPAGAAAQRELLAGELAQTRRRLEKNLVFMAQRYNYSLKLNYKLVPQAVTMMLVSKDDEGKVTTEVAHEFKDAKSYENFQALREEYLLRTVAAAREQIGDGEADALVYEQSAELKAMAGDLKTLYSFDASKDYQINFDKSALYARPAQNPTTD